MIIFLLDFCVVMFDGNAALLFFECSNGDEYERDIGPLCFGDKCSFVFNYDMFAL